VVIHTDTLNEWDEKIRVFVDRYGLQCYPQEFEICDHHDMIGYMAYSGMPSRYSHWSYGKSYEKQKMLYDYGVSGLPYEMVINSNPCLAYLMRDNSLLLQILTMAHVYGHNDFFANNFTFTSNLNAKYTLEMFKNHGMRVNRYMEDPSLGIDLVEQTLDDAHALAFQRSRNLAIRKLSIDEQRKRLWEKAQPKADPYAEIHPREEYHTPDLGRIPPEPEEDLLLFIAQYSPSLSDWQRDLINIVDKETRYFIPQMETKIMNEGWASYWHYTIMNALNLSQDLHFEFLVCHNQVLRPFPGGLNPYHMGFVLLQDIEKRWNSEAGISEDDFREMSPEEQSDTPGRKKIFEVRLSDRDPAFLRRFLTEDLMRELGLFQHEKRGKDRIVTKVSDRESWKQVRETLILNIGSGSIPSIKVMDADFGSKRTLYLKHFHDGRDLLLEYVEYTLNHLQRLWSHEVVLETEINGKPSLIKLDQGKLKVDKLVRDKKKSSDEDDD
jgi:stage V sporulation protein R